MGLFDKFKAGLQKTQDKLAHEIKRIVTRSPRLDAESLEQIEAALIAADLGMAMTGQIIEAIKKSYETQGGNGADVFGIARQEVAVVTMVPNRRNFVTHFKHNRWIAEIT